MSSSTSRIHVVETIPNKRSDAEDAEWEDFFANMIQ